MLVDQLCYYWPSVEDHHRTAIIDHQTMMFVIYGQKVLIINIKTTRIMRQSSSEQSKIKTIDTYCVTQEGVNDLFRAMNKRWWLFEWDWHSFIAVRLSLFASWCLILKKLIYRDMHARIKQKHRFNPMILINSLTKKIRNHDSQF